MRQTLFFLLAISSLVAQQPTTPAPDRGAKGSISGIVRDANTGRPVAEADVTVSNPPMRPLDAKSDAQGRYALKNIDPGSITISARPPRLENAGFPPLTRKFVTLGPGQELDSIDIRVRTSAQISGRVTDQNDQPLPSVSVILVAREYQLGEIRYVFSSAAQTDDEGKYVLNGTPGLSYYVMTKKGSGQVETIANTPADPKLRRPSFVPTFYPGAESVAGAQLIALASGDRHENVDIRMHRATSQCVEGEFSGSAGGTMRFGYTEASPHSGWSGDGGMFMGPNNGTSEDGKIRVCDLHPGDYRFEVYPSTSSGLATPQSYGVGFATVGDQDGRIALNVVPKIKVPAELVWADNDALQNFTPPNNWYLELQPIRRSQFAGELNLPRPLKIEPFSMELFSDDYRILFRTLPATVYLKDITYGSKSMLREPFHPGAAGGEATLHVILAHDGGTLSAHVADKHGKPLADHFVMLLPATSITEAAVAETVVSGQTDQNGAWTSPMVAPGKYYAFASPTPFDRSPETVTAILRGRQKAKDLQLASSDHQTIELTFEQ
jgi:hypothetical protein